MKRPRSRRFAIRTSYARRPTAPLHRPEDEQVPVMPIALELLLNQQWAKSSKRMSHPALPAARGNDLSRRLKLGCGFRLRGQLNSKRLEHPHDAVEFGLGLAIERAVQVFARHARLAGDLGHAAGPCSHANGVRNEGRIAGLQRLVQIVSSSGVSR